MSLLDDPAILHSQIQQPQSQSQQSGKVPLSGAADADGDKAKAKSSTNGRTVDQLPKVWYSPAAVAAIRNKKNGDGDAAPVRRYSLTWLWQFSDYTQRPVQLAEQWLK